MSAVSCRLSPTAAGLRPRTTSLGIFTITSVIQLPRVPYLLRAGANRAFHEGIGDLIGLAAGQRPYLKQVGLLSVEAEKADAVTFLLDTALDGASVVFLPWSAGVMTHFERDFYAGKISDQSLNAGWWALVGRYQGIAPPGERSETLCDAATKTHINDDPAQYYDYAIGTVIKFQLHAHIAATSSSRTRASVIITATSGLATSSVASSPQEQPATGILSCARRRVRDSLPAPG